MRPDLAACLCAGSLLVGSSAFAEDGSVGERITVAAQGLRRSLSADALESADYPFDDAERLDLRLAPFLLDGVSLRDMSPAAASGVGELLEASLGPRGHEKAEEIRALEGEVVRIEREEAYFTYLFAEMAGIRGRDLYFLTFYGDPAAASPWGYRFDGHHLSVNFTVVGDDVSPTPLFLGAQPREVPPGGALAAGLRVLAEEEDTARALYESLDEEQRARATLPLELGRDLFVGSGDRVDPDLPPVGIPRSRLSSEQKALMDAILEAYLGNVAAPAADRERERIDAAGRDALHFAWAGPTTPGEMIYYRLHGPTVLIEFDNTVDDAEHIHTLWRDPSGDFGADLLRRHHRASHATATAKE